MSKWRRKLASSTLCLLRRVWRRENIHKLAYWSFQLVLVVSASPEFCDWTALSLANRTACVFPKLTSRVNTADANTSQRRRQFAANTTPANSSGDASLASRGASGELARRWHVRCASIWHRTRFVPPFIGWRRCQIEPLGPSMTASYDVGGRGDCTDRRIMVRNDEVGTAMFIRLWNFDAKCRVKAQECSTWGNFVAQQNQKFVVDVSPISFFIFVKMSLTKHEVAMERNGRNWPAFGAQTVPRPACFLKWHGHDVDFQLGYHSASTIDPIQRSETISSRSALWPVTDREVRCPLSAATSQLLRFVCLLIKGPISDDPSFSTAYCCCSLSL